MGSKSPLIIFQQALPEVLRRMREDQRLRAIWYDGSSDLIAELFSYVDPSELWIEEGLQASLEKTCRGLSKRTYRNFSGPAPETQVFNACLLPSNDTHAHLFASLKAKSDALQFRTTSLKREGAEAALDQLGLAHQELKLDADHLRRFSVLLTANDWGTWELYTTRKFQDQGVPTACLQESVINFADKARRMEWSDYPLIQGLVTLKLLPSRIFFLTGNPRYEKLKALPLPTQPRVLINCNFTYGVFEEARDQWVRDAVKASLAAGMDYSISQHPRDRGDLSDYADHVLPSGAAKVHSMIEDATVIITRFSSLIHESLALGRKVIYYNPHDEKLQYDFEPDGRNLIVARSAEELKAALALSFQSDPQWVRDYLNRHCGCGDGQASQRVLQALQGISDAKTVINPVPFLNYARKFLRVQQLRWNSKLT